MKTLITGGTGFIGHALIKSLLDQDHQITVR
jgi:nucleoside-diphosphate-sugar epimerase